jgi:cytochrome P450
MAMQTEQRDYFTDHSVLLDPYEFFENARAQGPITTLPARDVAFVTGFEESLQILRNTEDYSSVISTGGPTPPLPFTPSGDDISEQIEAHRTEISASNLLVAYDGPAHVASRSLLTKLFVPSRLKANEEFMRRYADQLAQEVVAKGNCDLVNEVATPFVTLVIADLLGVPDEDREAFRKVLDAGPPAGNMESEDKPTSPNVLEYLAQYFAGYIQDRRANPRQDILTELATSTYPNGTLPDLMEVVRLATFLFAAGQDTSAKLLGNALRRIAEDPQLQQQLRDNRALIPDFIEEVLRLEGSTKCTFRLVRKNTKVGDTNFAAGDKIVIAFAAANRDPRRWPEPEQFKLGREKIKEHVAFGRGAHTCVGAPLARAEVRVMLDRLLEHTSEIKLSAEKHGPAGNRKFDYEPSFIIRGLATLFLELKPR